MSNYEIYPASSEEIGKAFLELAKQTDNFFTNQGYQVFVNAGEDCSFEVALIPACLHETIMIKVTAEEILHYVDMNKGCLITAIHSLLKKKFEMKSL